MGGKERLINFLPLTRAGLLEGGLNRGFVVLKVLDPTFVLLEHLVVEECCITQVLSYLIATNEQS